MTIVRTFALATILSAGCAAMTETSSSSPQNALTVTVNQAPPADKQEDKPAAPGFGHIWVQGYWEYMAGTYVWRPGRWVQGKPDYEYVRARYEYDGKAWVFHRPHWRKRHSGTAAGSPSNG